MSDAAAPAADAEPAARLLCLLFSRGEDRYALRADEVHKVTEPGRLNRLPLLPRAVLGIMQHRGRIVTVVDVAQLFDDPDSVPRVVGPTARVVILERGQRHVGLWVDAVEQIANIRVPEGQGGMTLLTHAGKPLCALDAEVLLRRALDLGAEQG